MRYEVSPFWCSVLVASTLSKLSPSRTIPLLASPPPASSDRSINPFTCTRSRAKGETECIRTPHLAVSRAVCTASDAMVPTLTWSGTGTYRTHRDGMESRQPDAIWLDTRQMGTFS